MIEKRTSAGNERDDPGTQSEAQRLEQKLFTVLNRINALEQELFSCERDLANCETARQLVYSSSSWRLTAPLRSIVEVINTTRASCGNAGALLVSATSRTPRLRGFLIAQLDRFPGLKERLRRLAMPALVAGWSEPEDDYARHITLEQLPPSAHGIYDILDSALGARSVS